MKAASESRVRVVQAIFLLHVFLGIYCAGCGVLDAYGYFRDWLIPGIAAFYGLLASAFLLPISAAHFLPYSGHRHPAVMFATHLLLALVQVIGLCVLVS